MIPLFEEAAARPSGRENVEPPDCCGGATMVAARSPTRLSEAGVHRDVAAALRKLCEIRSQAARPRVPRIGGGRRIAPIRRPNTGHCRESAPDKSLTSLTSKQLAESGRMAHSSRERSKNL